MSSRATIVRSIGMITWVTGVRPGHERDILSRQKVVRFLAEPFVGRFGLGSERTLADYEAYAGLDSAGGRSRSTPAFT